MDRRRKDVNWYVADESGTAYSEMREGCTLAVLMDLRDELKKLNNIFHCPNALQIPDLLRAIKKNTTKRPRKVKP